MRIEDNVIELQDKVSLTKLDELQDTLNNMKSINTTTEETLSHKLAQLKDDFENKTKEMMDNIEDLNKKMDELEEEEGSYDDESDEDLDSELGDTLDVNDMNRKDQDNDDKSSED